MSILFIMFYCACLSVYLMFLWALLPDSNKWIALGLDVLRDVSTTQVIKMLVVVVTLFAICWLPLHAFILLIDFRPDLTVYETISQKHFFVAVYSAVHWLAMSNSCVNPIIYGFLHDSFRVLLIRSLYSFSYSIINVSRSAI